MTGIPLPAESRADFGGIAVTDDTPPLEPGFYWTTNDDDPGFPKEDTLAVREWTGGSWMETGLQEPIDDQFVVVLSGRLRPPAE